MAQRPQTTHLASFGPSSPPNATIYNIYRTYIDIKKQVSIKIKKKNTYLWAMANDVSVVWARFCHRRPTQPSRSLLNTNGTYIDNKTLVSIKKRNKEKYLWPSKLVC